MAMHRNETFMNKPSIPLLSVYVISTMICALNADLATFVEGISNMSCLGYAHLPLTR